MKRLVATAGLAALLVLSFAAVHAAAADPLASASPASHSASRMASALKVLPIPTP